MKSEIEVETDGAGMFKQILDLSLESGEKVNYNLSVQENRLKVETETSGIGVLRGCTDTVFRLTMLTKKIYSR